MLGPEPIAVGLAGARRSRATRGPFPGSDGDAPSVLPRRVDAAHERTPSLPAPAAHSARGHAPTGKPSPSDHQGAWLGLAGQICAYAGVAVLTAGSGLLIVGHYGGPAAYAPYGWLISSVGQMLILLGVITLVSNGMDQIARQLGARIDALSTRMAGTAREFHGPHAGPPKPHGASAAPAATRPPLDAAST
jgi:hypothetical protein